MLIFFKVLSIIYIVLMSVTNFHSMFTSVREGRFFICSTLVQHCRVQIETDMTKKIFSLQVYHSRVPLQIFKYRLI